MPGRVRRRRLHAQRQRKGEGHMLAALNRLVVLLRAFSTYIWRQVLQC